MALYDEQIGDHDQGEKFRSIVGDEAFGSDQPFRKARLKDPDRCSQLRHLIHLPKENTSMHTPDCWEWIEPGYIEDRESFRQYTAEVQRSEERSRKQDAGCGPGGQCNDYCLLGRGTKCDCLCGGNCHGNGVCFCNVDIRGQRLWYWTQ